MKKRYFLVSFLIGIMTLSFFLYTQNKWITMQSLTVQSQKIPQNFDNFKIMHISDLHSQYFGENQNHLLKKIDDFKPDIIAITGDLFDFTYDELASFNLIEQLQNYPVYFVTGNHEAWSGHYDELEAQLLDLGVYILHNENLTLQKNGESIELLGIDDPSFGETVDNSLRQALSESSADSFKLLLSHRPESFYTYVDANIDLVLSGHAHGGQIRIPFLGGVIAPDQGFFPEFEEGIHTENQTTMVISRGLGNSIIPQRFFNRPHLIQITLKSDNL